MPRKAHQWPALAILVGASIQTKLIERQFSEVMRLAASINQGVVTASLREIGRVERTLFMPKWLQDPVLRRHVTASLNEGEARNSLAGAVFFQRLGEIRDSSYENQRYRADGLNLVVAAITLWNTVYLERAVAALRPQHDVDDSLLRHIATRGGITST